MYHLHNSAALWMYVLIFFRLLWKRESRGLDSSWLFQCNATWSRYCRRWTHRLGRVTSLSWECREESSCKVSAGLPSEQLPAGCPGHGPIALPPLPPGRKMGVPRSWAAAAGSCHLNFCPSGTWRWAEPSEVDKQLQNEFCNETCKICGI